MVLVQVVVRVDGLMMRRRLQHMVERVHVAVVMMVMRLAASIDDAALQRRRLRVAVLTVVRRFVVGLATVGRHGRRGAADLRRSARRGGGRAGRHDGQCGVAAAAGGRVLLLPIDR